MGLPLWVWVLLAVGLGFAHGCGDHRLMHLVLIVLMVDWCYSLSTFFFFLVLMVDCGLLVVVVSSVCSAKRWACGGGGGGGGFSRFVVVLVQKE